MSGFTGSRSPGSSGHAQRLAKVFTWEAARAMLPLVERIVADLVRLQAESDARRPELERLERHRLTLSWPERARRYRLEEELTGLARDQQAVQGELAELGVNVLHTASGMVGFPTVVNERPAYFSWRPGEDGLTWWNFLGDPVRRAVPEHWTTAQPRRPEKGKRSSRA